MSTGKDFADQFTKRETKPQPAMAASIHENVITLIPRSKVFCKKRDIRPPRDWPPTAA